MIDVPIHFDTKSLALTDIDYTVGLSTDSFIVYFLNSEVRTIIS